MTAQNGLPVCLPGYFRDLPYYGQKRFNVVCSASHPTIVFTNLSGLSPDQIHPSAASAA